MLMWCAKVKAQSVGPFRETDRHHTIERGGMRRNGECYVFCVNKQRQKRAFWTQDGPERATEPRVSGAIFVQLLTTSSCSCEVEKQRPNTSVVNFLPAAPKDLFSVVRFLFPEVGHKSGPYY